MRKAERISQSIHSCFQFLTSALRIPHSEFYIPTSAFCPLASVFCVPRNSPSGRRRVFYFHRSFLLFLNFLPSDPLTFCFFPLPHSSYAPPAVFYRTRVVPFPVVLPGAAGWLHPNGAINWEPHGKPFSYINFFFAIFAALREAFL